MYSSLLYNFLLFIFLIPLNIKTFNRGISPRYKNNKQLTPMRNPSLPSIFNEERVIEDIVISGLYHIPKGVILAKIPLKIGDKLDSKKTSLIVRNIFSLGFFSDVKVSYQKTPDNKIILFIDIVERKKVAKFIFKGNDHVSEETFEKQITFSKIQWIDDAIARIIIKKLEKIYKEKQYQHIDIAYELVESSNNSFDIVFTIKEGRTSHIKSIDFKGNKIISRHELKTILLSKEWWILGFLDRGGTYQKEMIDFDRYQIENFYHTKGFYEARVVDIKTEENEHNGMMDIVFYIDEGPQFTLDKISYINDSNLSSYKLNKIISLRRGELYNRDKLKLILEIIKVELSDLGYMYPTVYHKTKVNNENNSLDIEFIIEKGKPIYLQKINIAGNNKTFSDVIIREFQVNEGDILTARKLNASKQAVEGLGFFAPQTGVAWELEMIDKYQANLDLMLQEVKTGKFNINIAINSGSDAGHNEQQLNELEGPRWYDTLLTVSRIGLTIQDSNWNGKAIRYFLDLSYANADRSLTCGMSTPWFLDYPVSAGWNASYRNLIYDQFQQTTTTPNEKNQSANVQFGYRCLPLDMTLFGLSLGIDNISYVNPITPLVRFPDNPVYQGAYNQIVTRSFQAGTITWLNASISNDKKNHPTRASRGYKWLIESKMAIPIETVFKNISNFGFTRLGAEIDWYTPLITEYDVVLRLHGYAGYIHRFKDCNIPYKELFHIGGPQNVRGFLYGQIGPMLMGSSLGATKSFFVNAEIRCPIAPLNGMMALVFYDGGAGWDTIYQSNLETPTTISNKEDIQNNLMSFFSSPDQVLIRNNSLQYRHSVGVGVRITNPMPLKIDWGFKLDRNKKLGEPLSEVHIAMEGQY
jgi:outer membrane protein insertion porin family